MKLDFGDAKATKKMEANYLSFEGRITLIKATLSNPIYYLSIFKVPKRLRMKLKGFRTSFFGEAKKLRNLNGLTGTLFPGGKSMD